MKHSEHWFAQKELYGFKEPPPNAWDETRAAVVRELTVLVEGKRNRSASASIMWLIVTEPSPEYFLEPCVVHVSLEIARPLAGRWDMIYSIKGEELLRDYFGKTRGHAGENYGIMIGTWMASLDYTRKDLWWGLLAHHETAVSAGEGGVLRSQHGVPASLLPGLCGRLRPLRDGDPERGAAVPPFGQVLQGHRQRYRPQVGRRVLQP